MKKFAITSLLAMAVTFSLFALMAFIISNDNLTYIEPVDGPIVEVAQLPEDTPVTEKPPVKLTPPSPPPQMPRTTEVTQTSTIDTDIGYNAGDMAISKTPLEVASFSNRADADARPIVRVNPKYPIDAARNGLEGWVVLAFDINAIGEVTNIKIVDSEPKRVFDKAAKQALKKWKYRAKSQDGKAIAQHNFTVQLDFKMSQQT